MPHPLDINVFNIVTIAPADPAAGANFSFLVPVNARILPISINFTLVTAVAAADRLVSISGFDGTNLFCTIVDFQIQTASLTQAYRASIGNNSARASATLVVHSLPLSPYCFLRFGDSLIVQVAAIQAADQLATFQLRYAEWIQE